MSFSFSIGIKDLASNKLFKIQSSIHNIGDGFLNTTAKIQKYFKYSSKSVHQIMRLNTSIRKTEQRLNRLKNLPPMSFVQRIKRAAGAVGGFIGVAGSLYLVRDSFKKRTIC